MHTPPLSRALCLFYFRCSARRTRSLACRPWAQPTATGQRYRYRCRHKYSQSRARPDQTPPFSTRSLVHSNRGAVRLAARASLDAGTGRDSILRPAKSLNSHNLFVTAGRHVPNPRVDCLEETSRTLFGCPDIRIRPCESSIGVADGSQRLYYLPGLNNSIPDLHMSLLFFHSFSGNLTSAPAQSARTIPSTAFSYVCLCLLDRASRVLLFQKKPR